jgi:hypothetical protein
MRDKKNTKVPLDPLDTPTSFVLTSIGDPTPISILIVRVHLTLGKLFKPGEVGKKLKEPYQIIEFPCQI